MPNKISNVAEWAAILATVLLFASACVAQGGSAAAPPTPQRPRWLQELSKNPELTSEIGKLSGRLQHELHFPPPRTESRLLPLLPDSTIVYAAVPNYGDVMRQALNIFRQELQQSAALRTWWQSGEVGKAGPAFEESLDRIYALSQYLGSEIVFAGTLVQGTPQHPKPQFAILAEAQKPGLKEALAQAVSMSGSKSTDVLILDPQSLATGEAGVTNKLIVLVRPDFVVAAFDLPTVRWLNASLDKHSGNFASVPFGQRVEKAYAGGATTLAAVDVQKILSEVPIITAQNRESFERTGFLDAKYWVWRRKVNAGRPTSEAELSFVGPRRGAAAWLAAPGPMGSLDFVSPKAIFVGSALLKNLASIFDDVNEIGRAAGSKPFAGIEPFEQMFHVSLKDDVLSRLTGEMTFELDDMTPPQPAWKAILRVNDANALQQTVGSLLSAVHFEPQTFEDGGTTYRTLRIPSAKTTVELTYAFVDNYLIVASSREAAADAVRFHKNGNSLGKAQKFLASLPSGHATGVSALFYEDPAALAAMQLQRISPELAGGLTPLIGTGTPTTVGVYAEETAIREESTSGAFDVGGILVGAAIAIPNLLRSRTSANEASANEASANGASANEAFAVASIWAIVTAEAVYSGTYPGSGFARDLATLGPDPSGSAKRTAEHAGLLDASLAGPTCREGAWCEKSGFRFKLTTECKNKPCAEFLVVATPVGNQTGTRSFCATSEGVLRWKSAPTALLPAKAEECRTWLPLNSVKRGATKAAQ